MLILIIGFICFRIISMNNDASSDSKSDEYLYKHAGYLYVLMFLRKEIRDEPVNKQLVIDVNKIKINSTFKIILLYS